jgi:organic hydroperoxide reductase OsmC/OhrA
MLDCDWSSDVCSSDLSMSEVVNRFALQVERVDGFEFRVRFDKPQYPELRLDEPPTLGQDQYPNASRVLAAAIGNCLAASLTFCLGRAGVSVQGVRAEVAVTIVRNEHKRLRVGAVDVRLRPTIEGDRAAFDRCLTSFEEFCVVTQSVRAGVPVSVQVEAPTA